jgi:hypothetical protein
MINIKRCSDWNIGDMFWLFDDMLPVETERKLSQHIDYCLDCQIRFMQCSDFVLNPNNKREIDLEDC